ncbi:NADH-quinone oxidoreductase subunit E [Caloranaerobacter azorensis H53214]|uniref:NADH-quinone oxidoreductase subunit E n=2 Tax=Caloranaerobacter azorensis TaxID=116090 RepID=A0A096DL96_9FIRM|nr:NADH-quinone oxidoreductase subunit E [Caloranaerobacter azorensis H53214]
MYMNLQQIVSDAIDKKGNTKDKLIEILLEIQSRTEGNYVPTESLKMVSESLDIPLSKVYGVATFYSMLSVKKRGKYAIQICNSAPCYISGSSDIVKIFEEVLGIKMGEVTQDGMFSLEYTSCIGACNLAPAVKINDKVYGNLDRNKIIEIIASLRKGGE